MYWCIHFQFDSIIVSLYICWRIKFKSVLEGILRIYGVANIFYTPPYIYECVCVCVYLYIYIKLLYVYVYEYIWSTHLFN